MMEQNKQEAFLLKWGQNAAETWWYILILYDQDSAGNCLQILMVDLNFSTFLVTGGCYFWWVFSRCDVIFGVGEEGMKRWKCWRLNEKWLVWDDEEWWRVVGNN